MADMDVDDILAKQVEQLEKEKKELQEKLKSQEKKVRFSPAFLPLSSCTHNQKAYDIEIPEKHSGCNRSEKVITRKLYLSTVVDVYEESKWPFSNHQLPFVSNSRLHQL